ncbi:MULTISPECIES: cell division protein FtsL [unclassified Sporosarcina]|uniref:cell division protein FtsL n=1 Tax=unclassified Sporosarcina TaxID=2647733 RepID=UPI000C16F4B0|nr:MULTISPECIES: cell division protein FtsL [unclassified Sporosarcina]PIC86496.1 cell division protein FtsL [Sporosarcina sp. P20a]PID00082.1 cell division protein FtsL [Sporosarcina sp. P29]PID06764.1 cell division protein FtsL [Sporosarcina sp. P30]PID09959.1 cell division protein FtsL [Sporosarcina sp. P31]PID13538.1 cell division protein FtsL [Sporosarcina sp. P32b]
MGLEQRNLNTSQTPEIEQHTDQNQPQVVRRVKKRFSKGEKILFTLFAAFTIGSSSMLLQTHSDINAVNKEVQLMNTEIENTAKQNNELSIQVSDKSTYERIWKKAQENGLNLNEGNVKVVPGR